MLLKQKNKKKNKKLRLSKTLYAGKQNDCMLVISSAHFIEGKTRRNLSRYVRVQVVKITDMMDWQKTY